MYNTNFAICQQMHDLAAPEPDDYYEECNNVDQLSIDDVDLTTITAKQSSYITAYAYLTHDGEALMSRILHAAITSPDFIATHPDLANGFAEFAIEAENEGEVEL